MPDFTDNKEKSTLPVYSPGWVKNLYGNTPNPSNQPYTRYGDDLTAQTEQFVRDTPTDISIDPNAILGSPTAKKDVYDTILKAGLFKKAISYEDFTSLASKNPDSLYEKIKGKINISKEQIYGIYDNPGRDFYGNVADINSRIEILQENRKDIYNAILKAGLFKKAISYEDFTRRAINSPDSLYDKIKDVFPDATREQIHNTYSPGNVSAINLPQDYRTFERDMRNPDKRKAFNEQLKAQGIDIPLSHIQDIFADTIDSGGISIGSFRAFNELNAIAGKLSAYEKNDPKNDPKNYITTTHPSTIGAVSQRLFSNTPETKAKVEAYEKGRAPLVAEWEKAMGKVKPELATLKKNIDAKLKEFNDKNKGQKRDTTPTTGLSGMSALTAAYAQNERNISPEEKHLAQMSEIVGKAIKLTDAPTEESIEAFWKAMKNADIMNVLTLGLKEIDENIGLLKIARKQQRGEELTDVERSALNAQYLYESISAGKKPANAYLSGTAAVESIGFMMQIGLTGGILKGGIKAGEKYAIKTLRAALPKIGERTLGVTGKIVGNTVGAVAGAFAQSPAMPMFYNEGVRRMLGTLERTNTGDFVFKNAPTPVKAWQQAMIQTISEILGEYSGVWMGRGARALGFNIGRASKNIWGDLQRAGMFDGVIFETLEEYVTKALQTAFVGDQDWKDFFDADEFIQIIESVGVIGGFMGAGNATVNANNRRKFRKSQEKYWRTVNEDVREKLGQKLEELKRIKPSLFRSIPDQGANTPLRFFDDFLENPDVSLKDKLQFIASVGLAKEQAQAMSEYVWAKSVVDISDEALREATKRELSGMVNPQTGKIITGIVEGKEVTVLAQNDDVSIVQFEDGNRGAVPTGDVEIVEALSPEQVAEETVQAQGAVTDTVNDVVDEEEENEIKQFDTVHDENGKEWEVANVEETEVYLTDNQGDVRTMEPREFIERRKAQRAADNSQQSSAPQEETEYSPNVYTSQEEAEKAAEAANRETPGGEWRVEPADAGTFRIVGRAKGNYDSFDSFDGTAGTEAAPEQQTEVTPEQRQEAEKKDFIDSLPKNKKGEIDRKALTPEQQIKYLEYKRGKDFAVEAARGQIKDNTEKIKGLKTKFKGASLMEKDEIQDRIDAITEQNRVYEEYLGKQAEDTISEVMASDYLLNGGQDVIGSSDYLLRGLVGTFTKAAKQINDIRKKYADRVSGEFGDVRAFVGSGLYKQMMSEIRNVVDVAYKGNKEVLDAFDTIMKYPTGVPVKLGQQISIVLDKYNSDSNNAEKGTTASVENNSQQSPASKQSVGTVGTVGTRAAQPLTEEQANTLIAQMEQNAEDAPQLELTPENWESEFGDDGIVETPLGEAKMGDNQYRKIIKNGRQKEFGMIKPTLTNPDVIIEVSSEAKEGQETERPSSYLFVKTFNINGKKLKFFTSVTVSKDGMEVVVSNHIENLPRMRGFIKNGKLLYRRADMVPGAEVSGSTSTGQSTEADNPAGTSGDKGTAKKSNQNKKSETSVENNPHATERIIMSSPNEITDEDFVSPSRDIQLPSLPENTLKIINSEAKPVVIKKEILEKNGETHLELSPQDSRDILANALYNPDLVGQSQPQKHNHYWLTIKTGEKNATVVIDVYPQKDAIEIVGWRYINEKGIDKLKRQAEREGGQILILSPDNGSAAALSTLPHSSSQNEFTKVNSGDKGTAKKSNQNKKSEKPKKPTPYQVRTDDARRKLDETDLRGKILLGIATGDIKFNWRGTKTSKGISQQMGWGKSERGVWIPARKEMLKHVNILGGKESYTPEQLAHQLWEEDTFNHMDSQDILNEILDVLGGVISRTQALAELEQRLGNINDRSEDEALALQERFEEEEALINEAQEESIRRDIEKLPTFVGELRAKAELLGIELDFNTDSYSTHADLIAELKRLEENIESEYELYKLDLEEEKKNEDRKRNDTERHGRIDGQSEVLTQEGRAPETVERTAGERDRSGENSGDKETHLSDKQVVSPFGVSERLPNKKKPAGVPHPALSKGEGFTHPAPSKGKELTPAQQKTVAEKTAAYDNRIAEAEKRLESLRNEYASKKKTFGKRLGAENQTDLFGQPKNDNLFGDELKSDFSKENLTGIFSELQKQIDDAAKEASDLKKGRDNAVSSFTQAAQAQTEIKNDKKESDSDNAEKTTERINRPTSAEDFERAGLAHDKEHVYSPRDLRAFVNKFGNKQTARIFNMILDAAEKTGVKIQITGSETVGRVWGHYTSGHIYINENLINGDFSEAAYTIVHETIHGVTSEIMNAVRYGTKGILDKFTPAQIEAAKKLRDIFNLAKNDKSLSGEYGLKNAKEFIAELSNVEFVEKLSKLSNDKNIFRKIVSWIRQALGINVSRNFASQTENILGVMISNPVNISELHGETGKTGLRSLFGDNLSRSDTGPFGVSERLPNKKAEKNAPAKQSSYDFGVDGITEANAQEMKRIKEAAVTNGTFMKAPNGEKSNLNERQWLQVRTEGFKKFFGDWENDPENSSKVVDENGEPHVFTHETNGTFTQFKSGFGTIGKGIYFLPYNPRKKFNWYGKNSIDVFLNIKKPILEDAIFDETGYHPGSIGADEALRKKGFDGIISEEGRYGETVVFSPNQIKSATSNNGDFKDNEDDIRFQTAQNDRLEAVNEAFNKELQQQIDGTLPKGHTYKLGNAGTILQSASVPNLPIELQASRLSDKSMQENHPFDLSEVKDLPKAIQNPLAVFRSATHIGSFVIMTEIEHKGKNFVVALEANKRKGRIEVNDIRSIHYRNSNSHIANWIDEGLLEYTNKQKMVEWFSKQRYNSAEVGKLFNRAAKVIQNFKNPTLPDMNYDSFDSFDLFDGTKTTRSHAAGQEPKPISRRKLESFVAWLKKVKLAKDVVIDETAYQKEWDNQKQRLSIDGDVYGFVTEDGTIYLNPKKMNAQTLVHEFGHLWNSYIRKYNKPLWKRGIELAKQSEWYDRIKENPEAFGLAKNASDEKIADEALARLYGERGEAIFNEKGLGKKLLAWLDDVWKWIGSRFGIRDLTPEQIQNLTLEQFIDGAVADVLSGKPIPGSPFGVSKQLPNRKIDKNAPAKQSSYEDEENKNLVAVHNLSPANVLHAAKMGGRIPVPSIAIANTGNAFDDFGEITLIGDTRMADPKQGSNRVFNADIYSVRYPKIEKSFKDWKDQQKFEDDMINLANKNGGEYKYINKSSALDGHVTEEIIAAYLNEKGIPIPQDKYGSNPREYAYSPENKEAVERWLVDKLSKYNIEEKIFMGYTASGNRRYVPHTTENVTKIMTKKVRDAEGFAYGVGNVRANAAKQFKTLEGVKNSRDKIVDGATMAKLKEEVNAEFDGIVEMLKDNYKYDSNDYSYYDTVVSALSNYASGKRDAMSSFENIPAESRVVIRNFIDKLRDMPTEYFENKPQRAVGFEEFRIAVIPEGTKQEVIDILEGSGLQIVEYDKSVLGDRQKKIQEASTKNNIRFQLIGEKGAANLNKETERQEYIERYEAGTSLKERLREDRNTARFTAHNTIILYHGSSAENIESIRKTGLQTQQFLSASKKGVMEHVSAKRQHNEIIEMSVDPRDISYSSGTNEYYAENGLELGEDGVWASPQRIKADKARREGENRMKNLNIARQMETAKKDAKAIKMATGWERGADGKWRYEVPDNKFTISNEGKLSQLNSMGKNPIEDILKAYPQMNDYALKFDYISRSGSFNPKTKEIIISGTGTDESIRSQFLHEIQHAIQDIEGFAQGGNYSIAQEIINNDAGIKKKREDLNRFRTENNVQKILNKRRDLDFDESKLTQTERDILNEYHRLQKLATLPTVGQVYDSLSGEVEARNVQSRMNMTAEERRASLAAETEDVAREDQIFIYDSMGSQKDLERSGKNSNFAPQKNEKDNGRQEGKETRMDNGRTMGESALRGLVGEQPQGRRVRQTISEASAYERGDNGTPAQKGRGSWSKERFLGALEISAIKNGTWIDDIHTVAEKAISKGQENEVYRSLDNKHVIKVNNLSLSDAEYDFDNFIDRLQSHNELFGNATYKIIGFAENSLGEVSVVLEQPFIDGINATQREIDDYLSSVGFHKTTISDGEKGWTNGKYELWDAEPRNVLKDKNGNLYFIDTVVNSAKSGAESENLSSLEGLEIIDAPKHDFKNIAEARIWAKENITGTYRNADTGEDISVSSTAIGKYLSEKAIGKSDSLDAHLSALKQLPKLIETSVLRDAHKDRNNDTNIREIQRLYGAINYEWKNYPVKITVKVYQSENNKAYSYEVMQIENPVGTLGDHMQHADFLPRTTGFHVNESRGKGRTISENNNKKSTSDTKNDRFHTEAEQQADEISDWLDGFEGGAPRFQTVTPNLPNKKPTKPTTPTTPYLVEASRTREKYQDRAIKVRREEEELRKRGVKISIDQSAYEGIDKVPSRIMTKTNKMMDELYRPLDATIVEVRKILPADMVNQRTEELKKDLEESRKRIDDLKKAIKSEKDDKERDLLKTELRKEKNKAKIIKSQRDNGAYNVIGRYFIALHAPERNAYLKKTEGVNDGSGMSNADAAKIVANFEKVVPKNLVDKLKSQMSAIRDFNLDNMLHYGRITQAEYAELKTRYQYYVSLKGWEAKDEGYELQNYIDDGRSTGGGAYNILRHAEGRGSMADNPIDNMLQNSMNIISWGEKNNVKQKAYFIASANQQHDDLFSVDFIPKQNIEDFEAGQKDVEVWIAGEKHVIHYQQSEIANILNGAYGDDVYSAKWQNTFLAKATRYMSAINTAKNPRFAYKNAKRDIQQSAQRILIEDGPAMAGKFMRLEPTAVAALTKEVTSGGKKHLNKQIVGRDIYDAKKTFDVAELYQEFLLNGAVTGFIQSRKMEDVKKNIQKELNRAAGDVWFGKKAWDAANGLLDGMAEISESSTRFAVYMTYRTSGKTIAEATRKAKEATVNFNRKGERTAAWGALISFFNASIQSAENTYSLATRHPGWYLATAAAHAAKGFLMYKLSTMILQAMADGADDDDEKNRILDMLKDMTNYREYINFTIPIPWGDKNKVYTIPMSHAWRPFHALGVMTAQKMEGSISNKEFVENMVSLVSGSISPFDASSPRSFLPTFLTPITDVYFFNSDFMGIPITKEMFTKDLEENTKHLYKARQGTAPIFTEASKLAVRMAGFDPDNPDMREIDKSGGLKRLWTGLNLNPSRMEHLVRGFAGGVGKFFVDIATATAGIIEGTVDSIKGEEADFFPGGVNSIPLNDSVHEPYDSGFSRRKFYEMRKHLYDWEKTADEWEYKNDKTLTGDKVKTLDELLEKMHGYDNAIGILFDDIEDQRDKIADKKKRLKESVSNLRKRQLEAEIKAAETIIETKKKEQIRGYRKAYKELNPVFREMGVQYAK